MEYVRGRQDGQASAEGAAGNFSGRALMDAVLADGQVLLVSTGHGLVANREGQRHDLRAGDAVWAPPGEEHWHGAAPDALLSHTAISLGLTSWLEEVSADDYQAAFHHGA